jgi:RNA polymerase sigma-70 factor (ECF subfamily)
MNNDNRELVARARDGDRQAFDKLVKENKDKMFALTLRMTGDREAALDLMQDTFYTAFREIGRFRGEANFSSWLYRIASNKALNYLKRKKILSFIPLTNQASEKVSYEMPNFIDGEGINKELAAAVDSLPPKQKLVFNLRFYEQLPFGKIAVILKKSESTVKTNYQKAIEKLRKKLEGFR